MVISPDGRANAADTAPIEGSNQNQNSGINMVLETNGDDPEDISPNPKEGVDREFGDDDEYSKGFPPKGGSKTWTSLFGLNQGRAGMDKKGSSPYGTPGSKEVLVFSQRHPCRSSNHCWGP